MERKKTFVVLHKDTLSAKKLEDKLNELDAAGYGIFNMDDERGLMIFRLMEPQSEEQEESAETPSLSSALMQFFMPAALRPEGSIPEGRKSNELVHRVRHLMAHDPSITTVKEWSTTQRAMLTSLMSETFPQGLRGEMEASLSDFKQLKERHTKDCTDATCVMHQTIDLTTRLLEERLASTPVS